MGVVVVVMVMGGGLLVGGWWGGGGWWLVCGVVGGSSWVAVRVVGGWWWMVADMADEVSGWRHMACGGGVSRWFLKCCNSVTLARLARLTQFGRLGRTEPPTRLLGHLAQLAEAIRSRVVHRNDVAHMNHKRALEL